MTYFSSGALYWMRQLLKVWLKRTSSGMDVLSLMSFFQLYPGSELSFKHNSACESFFWVPVSVGIFETDQKVIFGGTIGYGDSNLEFLFRPFKVLRLHAILHDAAGAVRAHSGRGLGYCYLIGRGPISCLLSHVTRLLFWIYVEHFIAFHFQLWQLLKQKVLHCITYWTSRKNSL